MYTDDIGTLSTKPNPLQITFTTSMCTYIVYTHSISSENVSPKNSEIHSLHNIWAFLLSYCDSYFIMYDRERSSQNRVYL